MDKLEQAGNLANSLALERPYSEPGLPLGTSSFTADGWQGSFYLPGMQTRNFLPFYATQFKTVETDSTYNWYERMSALWGSIPGNSSAEWAY